MRFDLSSMERGELCHDRCMDLLLTGHTRSIGAARSNARGAFVQAPYLSPGFSDFGRLARVCVEVGADCAGGRVFVGGSKDLMQETSEERHVMVEVHPEGCAYELCLDITLNRQDMRSRFGYTTLYDTPKLGLIPYN